MAEAMRFMIGNTTCVIMDDCCSYPDQAERNARARRNIEEIVSRAYLADPEGFERRGDERNRRRTPTKRD
ncbi:MAG: hypothetical protein PHU31_05450 [Anaerotignum sp.]|nr:hypothetical protein [Anaerotignum sp.]